MPSKNEACTLRQLATGRGQCDAIDGVPGDFSVRTGCSVFLSDVRRATSGAPIDCASLEVQRRRDCRQDRMSRATRRHVEVLSTPRRLNLPLRRSVRFVFFAALIGRKQPTRGSLEKIPRGSARSWARQSVEICERNCRQPTEYTPTVGRSSFLTLRRLCQAAARQRQTT